MADKKNFETLWRARARARWWIVRARARARFKQDVPHYYGLVRPGRHECVIFALAQSTRVCSARARHILNHFDHAPGRDKMNANKPAQPAANEKKKL